MGWNEKDDIENHPATCFCSDCTGEVPIADEAELNEVVDAAVSFINKMVSDTTRTVWQGFKQYNHYEREYNDMAFVIRNTGNNNDNTGGERRRKGLQTIDAERDLSPVEQRRVTITWAGDPKEANGPKWATVTVRLQSANSKQERLWNLSGSNPNLDVLIAGLGNDAHAWVNRELLLSYDVSNPSRTPYIRTEIVPLTEPVAETIKNEEKA